eukprot:CFRG5259T1
MGLDTQVLLPVDVTDHSENNSVRLSVQTALTSLGSRPRPLRYVTVPVDHAYPEKKQVVPNYEKDIPVGILRSNWMFKHVHEIPSVAVIFFELEWGDPHWSEREAECASKLLAVRNSLAGRLCKLVVVLLHKFATAKDDPQADSRALSFRRACEVEGKNSLFILPLKEKENNPDEFQGYINRLDGVFKELASNAYDDRAARVRNHRVPTGAPGYSLYTIRHQFKLGFFNETLTRSHEAIRHYSCAYSELLTLGQRRDQSRILTQIHEIRAMAGLINHRSCSLQLVLNHWKAIELFRRHLSHFKEAPMSATIDGNSALTSEDGVESFRHLSWISRQYQVFGELFLQAVTVGAVQADQSHHPGFYLRQAAIVAIRRHACYRQIMETTPTAPLVRLVSIDRDGSQNKPADTYVGHESIEIPGQAAQIQEADFVNEVVELLAQSRIQYKRFKCARMTRCIAVQIADQYLQAKLYDRAFLVYEKVHMVYRHDGWDVLVDIVLRSALVCACALGRLERAIHLALESASLPFNGTAAEREACLQLAQRLLALPTHTSTSTHTSAFTSTHTATSTKSATPTADGELMTEIHTFVSDAGLFLPTTPSDLTVMVATPMPATWTYRTIPTNLAQNDGIDSDIGMGMGMGISMSSLGTATPPPSSVSTASLRDMSPNSQIIANIVTEEKKIEANPILRFNIAMAESLPIVNCAVRVHEQSYSTVDPLCVSVTLVSNMPRAISLESFRIVTTEPSLERRCAVYHQTGPQRQTHTNTHTQDHMKAQSKSVKFDSVTCVMSENERTFTDLTLEPGVPRVFVLELGACAGVAGPRSFEVQRVELSLGTANSKAIPEASERVIPYTATLVFEIPRSLHFERYVMNDDSSINNKGIHPGPQRGWFSAIGGGKVGTTGSVSRNMGAGVTGAGSMSRDGRMAVGAGDYSRTRIGLRHDENLDGCALGVEAEGLCGNPIALHIFKNEQWSARLTPRPSRMSVTLLHHTRNSAKRSSKRTDTQNKDNDYGLVVRASEIGDKAINVTSENVSINEVLIPPAMDANLDVLSLPRTLDGSHLHIKPPSTPTSTPNICSVDDLVQEDASEDEGVGGVDQGILAARKAWECDSSRGKAEDLKTVAAVTGEVCPISLRLTNQEVAMVTDLHIEVWETPRDADAGQVSTAGADILRCGLLSWNERPDEISMFESNDGEQTTTHTLQTPLPELLPGAMYDVSFYLHDLTEVGERLLGARLSYMCDGVATITEITFPVTITDPFEWHANVAHQYRSVNEDAVASGDTFMVMVDVLSKIPFSIDELRTELKLSSSVEMASGAYATGLKGFGLAPGDAWNECMYLKCNPTLPIGGSIVVDVGEMIIHWKSAQEQRWGSCVIFLPSVVVQCQPLILKTDMPSVGFLNVPLTVTHRLFNKSDRVQHVALSMEASEFFMFSGYKHSKSRILPMSCQSHTYQLCPLACGLLRLPKLNLQSLTDDMTISFATSNMPTHIYVKPS